MTQDGEPLNESEEITSSTLRPTRAAATRVREQDSKTPFFRNRNFLLVWGCRGVSANLNGELETSQKAWLKAGRLGYSQKTVTLEKRGRSEHGNICLIFL